MGFCSAYCSLCPVGAFVVRGDEPECQIHGGCQSPDGCAALIVHADGINEDALSSPKQNSLRQGRGGCFVAEVRHGLDVNVSSPACDHEHARAVRPHFRKCACVIQMDSGCFRHIGEVERGMRTVLRLFFVVLILLPV